MALLRHAKVDRLTGHDFREFFSQILSRPPAASFYPRPTLMSTTASGSYLPPDRAQPGSAPLKRDELFREVYVRLEQLARGMLRKFPKVHRWEDTSDVLHNSLMRLLRALDVVQPQSQRHFWALAAEQMRRELIDLARHYQGPLGLGANHLSAAGESGTNDPAQNPEDDRDGDPRELETWCSFHEAVAQLPDDEREVVGLLFYHGRTQAEVAELFGVDVRTVRRWWQRATLRLHEQLRGDLPPL